MSRPTPKSLLFSLFLSIFSKNVLPDFLSEKLKQAGEIRELQLDLKQNLLYRVTLF